MMEEASVLPTTHQRAKTDSTTLRIAALSKSSIPTVLVATKCDALPEERQIDPSQVETRVKRTLKNLSTVQTSAGTPETQKRSLSVILRAIATAAKGKVRNGETSPVSDCRLSILRVWILPC
jgi:GTP-binding protein EngB required for normal cell division